MLTIHTTNTDTSLKQQNYNFIKDIQINYIKQMSKQMKGQGGYQGAADDIKKGLQKIKQAQIQVMRELKKDDVDYSRNHSLSYSKETTYQLKNNFNNSARGFNQPALTRFRTDKIQRERDRDKERERDRLRDRDRQRQSFDNINNAKLRQQIINLSEQVRKNKQAYQKAESKMREYEKSQQRALAKAQQALSNAIQSEKKYIDLKTQYDKVFKHQQRLSTQLKQLQQKQLSQMTSQSEPQPLILSKLTKQLRSANDIFNQLTSHINVHKCTRKQASTTSNTNSNTINAHHSVNSFTISTFQLQSKLNKYINNAITYIGHLHNFVPIEQISSRIYPHADAKDYLTGSFRDDIRVIEEQLDAQFQGREGHGNLSARLSQLEINNKILQQKNKKYSEQVYQKQKQIQRLKRQLQEQKKQLQTLNQSNKSSKDSQPKERRSLFQKYKHLASLAQSQPVNAEERRRLSSKKTDNSSQKYGPDPLSNSITLQFIQQRLLQLQKQNQQLSQTLQKTTTSFTKQIESLQKQNTSIQKQNQILKKQLIQIQVEKQSLQKQLQSTTSIKPQTSNFQYMETIKQLQMERDLLKKNQGILLERIREEGNKYGEVVGELEVELRGLKREVEELRAETGGNGGNGRVNDYGRQQHVQKQQRYQKQKKEQQQQQRQIKLEKQAQRQKLQQLAIEEQLQLQQLQIQRQQQLQKKLKQQQNLQEQYQQQKQQQQQQYQHQAQQVQQQYQQQQQVQQYQPANQQQQQYIRVTNPEDNSRKMMEIQSQQQIMYGQSNQSIRTSSSQSQIPQQFNSQFAINGLVNNFIPIQQQIPQYQQIPTQYHLAQLQFQQQQQQQQQFPQYQMPQQYGMMNSMGYPVNQNIPAYQTVPQFIPGQFQTQRPNLPPNYYMR